MDMLLRLLWILIFSCITFQIEAQTMIIPESQNKDTYKKITFQFSNKISDQEIIDFGVKYFPEIFKNGFKLKLESLISSPLGQHLTLLQTFDGFDIEGTGLKINIGKDGVAYSCLAQFYSNRPSNSMSFTADTQAILKSVLSESKGKLIGTKICWLISENKLIPTYKVITLEDQIYSGTDHFYHAKTSELIIRKPKYVDKQSDIGKGRVFIPDPLTSSGNYYDCAELYCDNSDSNNVFFDSQYRDVVLNGISKINDSYRLIGPFASNQDIDFPPVEPEVSTDGNFYFNRSQPGFEQVNIYYHIDRFQRYVQSLGFNNLCNHSLRYDAQGLQQDNSKFISEGINSYLLFGVGGVDDAEDMDVIIHEYTHALSAWGSPRSMDGYERKALDEGICDYFAASESKNISEFRWQEIYTWDGHNTFWKGRIADSKDKYSELRKIQPTIHIMGQVWSSCLMKVYDKIGKKNLDFISFQELYMNNVNMSIKDAAYNLLDIDSLHFQSLYRKELISALCEYEIFSKEECEKLSSNDSVLPISRFIKINNSLVQINQFDHKDILPDNLKIFDYQGRLLMNKNLSIHNLKFPEEIEFNESTGIYLLCFSGKDILLGTIKLPIKP